MAWYQCSCGFLTEESPRYGEVVVSVYHLHPGARLDGGSAAVRMGERPDPVSALGKLTPPAVFSPHAGVGDAVRGRLCEPSM